MSNDVTKRSSKEHRMKSAAQPRNHRFEMRLSDDESELIEAYASELQMSKAQLVRMMILKPIRASEMMRPVIQINDDGLLGLRSELNRIGVNVNQIARAVNVRACEGTTDEDREHMENLDDELGEIAAQVEDMSTTLFNIQNELWEKSMDSMYDEGYAKGRQDAKARMEVMFDEYD